MVIKIFNLSTLKLAIIPNKKYLIQYIERETGKYVSNKLTINQLMNYLPIENYCRIK